MVQIQLIDIQGFKNKPVATGLICPLINNMLRVTVVKIIAFWPFMNFSQSHGFAESDAYFKTF